MRKYFALALIWNFTQNTFLEAHDETTKAKPHAAAQEVREDWKFEQCSAKDLAANPSALSVISTTPKARTVEFVDPLTGQALKTPRMEKSKTSWSKQIEVKLDGVSTPTNFTYAEPTPEQKVVTIVTKAAQNIDKVGDKDFGKGKVDLYKIRQYSSDGNLLALNLSLGPDGSVAYQVDHTCGKGFGFQTDPKDIPLAGQPDAVKKSLYGMLPWLAETSKTRDEAFNFKLTPIEQRMIDATNLWRAKRKPPLPPLEMDPVLMKTARERAPYYNHSGGNGKSSWDQARDNGFRGEATDNLAQNYSPEGAVENWGAEEGEGHQMQQRGYVKINGQWVDRKWNRIGVANSGKNYIAIYGRLDN